MVAGPALQLKPVRKSYLGRTNKWGSLGRPAAPNILPMSDRFAQLTPARARSDQRAEVARSLRPQTAHVQLAATLPRPMHIRPHSSAPLHPSPTVPATRMEQSAVPEAAQRALLKACPSLALSREPSRSLAGVFKAWDKDSSGALSHPDFQAALRHLGIRSDDPAIEALVRRSDGQSGGIDYNKMADYVAKGMIDASGAASGGIVPELRLVLDRMHAQGIGGGGAAGASPPGPAPTRAQRVLMARVRRAAEARAEAAEAEAARRQLHALWRSPTPEDPSRPAVPPRPTAETEARDREAEARARREERRLHHQTQEILSKVRDAGALAASAPWHNSSSPNPPTLKKYNLERAGSVAAPPVA